MQIVLGNVNVLWRSLRLILDCRTSRSFSSFDFEWFWYISSVFVEGRGARDWFRVLLLGNLKGRFMKITGLENRGLYYDIVWACLMCCFTVFFPDDVVEILSSIFQSSHVTVRVHLEVYIFTTMMSKIDGAHIWLLLTFRWLQHLTLPVCLGWPWQIAAQAW